MNILSQNTAFGGMQGVFSHQSEVTGTEMTFAVFVPPQAIAEKRPVLWYLSGLTCTWANVMEKGGIQEHAAAGRERRRHGLELREHHALTDELPLRRAAAHLAGKGAKYTRANPPLRILASLAYQDRSAASVAEAQLKKLPRVKKVAYFA